MAQTVSEAGIPRWLELLKPWMAEAGTVDARLVAGRRYSAMAAQLGGITPAGWRKLDVSARRVALAAARAQVPRDHVAARYAELAVESIGVAVVRPPVVAVPPALATDDHVGMEVLAAVRAACAHEPSAALRTAQHAVNAAQIARGLSGSRNGDVAELAAGGALAAAAIAAAVVAVGPVGWLGLVAIKAASHSKEVQDVVGGAFGGVMKAARWAATSDPAAVVAARVAAGREVADRIAKAVIDDIEAELVSVHWG